MHAKMSKKTSFSVKNMENIIVLLEKTALTWSIVGGAKKLLKLKRVLKK